MFKKIFGCAFEPKPKANTYKPQIEENSIVLSIMESNKEKECDICEGSNKYLAQIFCSNCKCHFCESHSVAYHSKGAFKDHTLAKLSETVPTICKEHGKAFEFLCSNDSSLICYSCALSEKHKSHKQIEISEAIVSAKQKILKNKQIYEDLFDSLNQISADLTHNVKTIPELCQRLNNEYHSQFQELFSVLEAQKEKSHIEINNVADNREKVLTKYLEEVKKLGATLQYLFENSDFLSIQKKTPFEVVSLLIELKKAQGDGKSNSKTLENVTKKLENVEKVLKYRPNLTAVGASLSGIFTAKLLWNSSLNVNSSPEYLSTIRYCLGLNLIDENGAKFFPESDLFFQASVSVNESKEKRPILVYEKDKNYYVEAKFEPGENYIHISLSGSPLVKSPFRITVEMGECGILKGNVHFCKGKSNGCQEAARTDTYLYGPNPYVKNSGYPFSNCLAALHSGVINTNGGKYCIVETTNSGPFTALTKNGITSYAYAAQAIPFDIYLIQPTECGFLNGMSIYSCRGSDYCKNEGEVYGSGPYLATSSICRAMKYSGKLNVGDKFMGGTIKINYRKFKGSLKGSKNNGVKTLDFKCEVPEEVFDFGLSNCQKIGDYFYCIGINNGCPAQTKDYVWGSNPYTNDADMCGCAVHAGVIDRDGGFFKITNLTSYQGNFNVTTANGFTSKFWQGPYSAVKLEKTPSDFNL